jgi:hypothetical protein
MTQFEEAAIEVHEVLERLGLPYAIIGGVAVQRWGEPRFTKDIDLAVIAPVEEFMKTIQTLLESFSPRLDDTLEVAQRGRVLTVKTTNGYPVDISFGIPGYEEHVMERTVEHSLSSGQIIRLCSAEDLIIHKAVARRVQDVRDLESVIIRQGKRLDLNYIRYWLAFFAEVLETNEVIDCFERSWSQFRSNP